jgi:hypothetical protein
MDRLHPLFDLNLGRMAQVGSRIAAGVLLQVFDSSLEAVDARCSRRWLGFHWPFGCLLGLLSLIQFALSLTERVTVTYMCENA